MKIGPVTKEILEWIFCIAIAIVIALLVRYYIGTPTVVKNVSMNPTLVANQRLWLNRWNRTIGKIPERGDIITFEAPSDVLSSQDVKSGRVTAKYNNDKKSVWGKFVYYVLEVNKTSYIKRVIALPGEHVLIQDGKVYINNKELEESYLQAGIVTDLEKGGYVNDFVVPENTVFALGDNRTESKDCRVFGCVPLEKIESKVALRFWPLNLFGTVK